VILDVRVFFEIDRFEQPPLYQKHRCLKTLHLVELFSSILHLDLKVAVEIRDVDAVHVERDFGLPLPAPYLSRAFPQVEFGCIGGFLPRMVDLSLVG
jgi:hypothetical protein